MQVLIYKALTDYNEFISINNVLENKIKEKINRCLLAGDKYKTKNEYKDLKKWEICLFIKLKQIKLVFNMA